MDGYILLFRKIEEWGWYDNGNVFRVFIHILIKAAYKGHEYRGMEIHPGEMMASVKSIADDLKMSSQQVRTALQHLQETGEITVRSSNQGSVIAVTNWDKYQCGKSSETSKTTAEKPKAAAARKKPTEFVPPTKEEVKAYIEEKGYNVDPDYFYDYYSATGWTKANGQPVKNWKSTIVTWSHREEASAKPTEPPKTVYSADRWISTKDD